jgi:hypothetical protein
VLAAVRALPGPDEADGDGAEAPGRPGDRQPGGHQDAAQEPAEAVAGSAGHEYRLDVRDPRLGRVLRTLPVPATLLAGDDAAAFAGTAAPLETPAP